MMHELKILTEHFVPVRDGLKTAELRLNDRDYKVGDCLHMREWCGYYTGNQVIVEVKHVADVGVFATGYVLLSIEVLP